MPSIVTIDSIKINTNIVSYMKRIEEILYNCKLIFSYSFKPEIFTIK